MAGELRDKGGAAIVNGWPIVEIPPGGKRPIRKGWPQYLMTEQERLKLVANGHAGDGFGVITKDTPAIDIEISDAVAAKHIQDWAETNIGFAPIRIGRPPRRLMAYRTNKPFSKISSKVYRDDKGRKAAVEILGNGQQYVSHADHPDTKKPYTWIGGSPETIKVDELCGRTHVAVPCWPGQPLSRVRPPLASYVIGQIRR